MDKEEMKEKISNLPRGYISNKKIQGKIRHYLQWCEGGKIKSQYIPDDEVQTIKKAIVERKRLEKKLKAEKLKQAGKPKEKWQTNVTIGEDLSRLVLNTRKLEKRDCYKNIVSYIYGDITPRICSVYGLRRTGKTTMLLQTIAAMDLDHFSKSAYIKIRKGETMRMIDNDLKALFNQGYRYIFIDEITLMEDFIDTASLLSDIYACMGMKIVISGTDSLGIFLAGKNELYDRTSIVHTTWIPFSEHSRLLKTDDIDEYIRFGGTLRAGETNFDDEELKSGEISFADEESTRRYIDTAICENIQHSLKCYENGSRFRKLYDLYEKDELTNAINRIVESMNHRFVLKVLTEDFKSTDLSLAKKNLLKEKDENLKSDVLFRINESHVIKRLMEILKIENQDKTVINLTDEHIREIKEYLFALELIEECPVRYLGAKNEDEDYNILITQPGIRYCQAEALLYSLKKDELFSSVSEKEKNYLINKILDEVKGRMLEEIVLYETMRKKKSKYEIFKLEFIDGEFDMVIMDKDFYQCRIFEIKHSKEIAENQYRHIANQEKCEEFARLFGPIIGKYVLYRGEAKKLDNGIEYLNVSSYLKSL